MHFTIATNGKPIAITGDEYFADKLNNDRELRATVRRLPNMASHWDGTSDFTSRPATWHEARSYNDWLEVSRDTNEPVLWLTSRSEVERQRDAWQAAGWRHHAATLAGWCSYSATSCGW